MDVLCRWDYGREVHTVGNGETDTVKYEDSGGEEVTSYHK